jgi:tetratricopeptide (TPR) repeat protein
MIVQRAVACVAVLVGLASAANAQSWVAPKCDVKPGHFLVNSAVLYLKHATETKFDDQKKKDLRDAERVLTQALTTGDQQKNPAAWYYYARYHVLAGDMAGADTAFQRAESLKPDCKDDIATWRRQLWTPVFNQGVQAFNANKSDSAIYYFQRSTAIYPEPTGLSALAGLYANAGQTDSALRYYGRAAEVAATDTQWAKERKEALYNRAAVLYQNKRWGEAIEAFKAYLAAYPADGQAISALASAYSMNQQADSALAIYQRVLAKADSADPATLFSAGAAMFNSVAPAPDTGTTAAACRRAGKTAAQRQRCSQEARAAMKQHDSLSAGTYRMAARAFEAGLARAPYSRDGLYNLTSSLYLLQDSTKMLPVARRLIAVDPMNRNALRLAAAAYQMKGMTDSTVLLVSRAESTLVVDVNIQTFRGETAGATLDAIVTNFHNKPSAPLKLVFEFLKSDGSVAASQTAEVPQLAAGAMHQVKVQATGAGITAWRYRQE